MEGNNQTSDGGGADSQPASSQRTESTDPDGANTATSGGSGSATTTPQQPPPRESALRSASSATAPPTMTSSTTQIPTLRKQLSGSLSNAGSSSASPAAPSSRNASPIRREGSRVQPLAQPLATQPSAAAIQRALSAAAVPSLQSNTQSNPSGETAARASRPGAPGSGQSTPQWPVSPRLKSPPPGSNARRTASNVTTAKKAPEGNSANTPSVNVQAATPTTSTAPSSDVAKNPITGDAQQKALQAPASAKGPSRGPSGISTLETVQENADDIKEPSAAALRAVAGLRPLSNRADDDVRTGVKREAESQHVESGSESAGKGEKKQEKTPTAAVQNPSQRPKNVTKLSSVKSRQGEGKQGMTVETETVSSIPQSAINTGDRSSTRNDNSGSIRLKTSNETIRPKKERKKAPHKPRSINQSSGMFSFRRSPFLTSPASFENSDLGSRRSSQSSIACEDGNHYNESQTLKRSLSYSEHLHRSLRLFSSNRSNKRLRKASSKADIFEARVASAVDEANSSDSDETFVYESNPPDPQRRNPRHHSRTPSVASSHSVADQTRAGLRPFTDAQDDRRVAGKRSMKFSNNLYNDLDSPESKDGSVRSHQPRHFGRFGRGGSHASMFDPESPYTQASKLRPSQVNSQRRSHPDSPRSGQQPPLRPSPLTGRKQESSYDMDVEGADDERTPLMGNNPRIPHRGSRSVRRPGLADPNNPELDSYYGVRRYSRCGRYGGCVLGFCIVALVIISAVGFLVMSNRPLYAVQIDEIQNILASEQELFLDLCVRAVNPNSLAISISDVELDIFAKSKYVGSNAFWRHHGFPDPESAVERIDQLCDADTLQCRDALSITPPPEEQQQHQTYHSDMIIHPTDKSSHGTDPPNDDDLERDAQVMLLGRIYHFDNSLSFDGRPMSHREAFSIGSLRLDKPGNKTETGGSARWEKVLKHPFDLIVRGTLRYTLPVSGRAISASVQGRVRYDADDAGDGDGGKKHHVGFDGSEGDQWIEVEYVA